MFRTDEKFASVIFAALRIEPRITKIILSNNNLGKFGLFELSKTLLFNKNIKIIEYENSIIHSYEFPFMNYGLGIFENKSVEELKLSHNLLNSNCEENLAKFISYFKGLKTLKLSHNNLKNGISSFFIALRKLYSKRQSRLENLYLQKCFIDEKSFYELGQLIKSKYCKLKILSLCFNKIPIININFWKQLMKNKSLDHIYLHRNYILNEDIKNIEKVISNSYIQNLYLYKNKINNFNNCLKILYRTKLIKDKNEENYIIIKNESFLNFFIFF